MPFNSTLKKLKEFKSFPEDVQDAVTIKMQEIESLLAS